MRKRRDLETEAGLQAELRELRRRVANLERSKANYSRMNFALKDLVFKLDDRAKGLFDAVDIALQMQGVSKRHVRQIVNGERPSGMPPELSVLQGGQRPTTKKRRRRKLRLVTTKPDAPRG